MRQRLNVLLIDDDTVDVMMIRQTLTAADPHHFLTVADDGAAAMIVLHNREIQHPYIILLDLYMPKMDGIVFLEELRHDAHLRRNIVFVLTTSTSDIHRQRTYQQGISGYLIKENLGARFEYLGAFLTAYNNLIVYPELQ